MADHRFFPKPAPLPITQVANLTGATREAPEQPDATVTGVASLDQAQAGDICFYASAKHEAAFLGTKATACFVKSVPDAAPENVILLTTANPEQAFAKIARHLYTTEVTPAIHPNAVIDPSVTLGDGCCIEAGVVIGQNVNIGENVHIKANTVIEAGVQIGRNSRIGANCVISHALIGDRVILHGGVVIGSDGFGYVATAAGHEKIPQLGRAIIQDDVEIGACTTIDRGALGDTVIGAGTKIDNLVQIGHNCQIGQHCVIAGHVGISGSVNLGDFVALGGQVGIADHANIASGVQIAAKSGVPSSLPKPGVYGGTPVKPMADWRREVATLNRLVKQSRKKANRSDE